MLHFLKLALYVVYQHDLNKFNAFNFRWTLISDRSSTYIFNALQNMRSCKRVLQTKRVNKQEKRCHSFIGVHLPCALDEIG